MGIDADAAVKAAFGIDTSTFTHRSYYIPQNTPGCYWGGVAYIGCTQTHCKSWIRDKNGAPPFREYTFLQFTSSLCKHQVFYPSNLILLMYLLLYPLSPPVLPPFPHCRHVLVQARCLPMRSATIWDFSTQGWIPTMTYDVLILTGFRTRRCIGPHACWCERSIWVIQWHASRVSTLLPLSP
jgi:hypothetical protein